MPAKTKQKPELYLTDSEKLMVQLDAIVKSGGKNARVSSSLLMWRMKHKSWTFKQFELAKKICASLETVV